MALTMIALVRKMRQAQITYYSTFSKDDARLMAEATGAVDDALQVLSDDKPAIWIGTFFGADAVGAPQPAAYICLDPLIEGEPLEAVLEVYPDHLDEIDPTDDDALHEFVLKWERYALEHHLHFDVDEENFVERDNRWKIKED